MNTISTTDQHTLKIKINRKMRSWWDDSVDERISRLANKFEFSDDKSKGDMLKKLIDVLKHTSHRPTDKYDQLYSEQASGCDGDLAKNLPDDWVQ